MNTFTAGLALGFMLLQLFGIVYAVNGEPNVAASFAAYMFGLLGCIGLVLGVALIERTHRDRSPD